MQCKDADRTRTTLSEQKIESPRAKKLAEKSMEITKINEESKNGRKICQTHTKSNRIYCFSIITRQSDDVIGAFKFIADQSERPLEAERSPLRNNGGWLEL